MYLSAFLHWEQVEFRDRVEYPVYSALHSQLDTSELDSAQRESADDCYIKNRSLDILEKYIAYAVSSGKWS